MQYNFNLLTELLQKQPVAITIKAHFLGLIGSVPSYKYFMPYNVDKPWYNDQFASSYQQPCLYNQELFEEQADYTQADHAVLLLGYDIDPYTGNSYWIIRNSWGPQVGDKGNYKLLRTTKDGQIWDTCGILFPFAYFVGTAVYATKVEWGPAHTSVDA